MNKQDCVNFYIKNRNTFFGEKGHTVLLSKLIPIIDPCDGHVLGIDVGSCVGDYVPYIKQLCQEPNKKILCFEPNPLNLKQLKNKFSTVEDIDIYNCAISNTNTTDSLFLYKTQKQNMERNGVCGLRSGGNKICDVNVRTLENILDNYSEQIPEFTIKYIKIDTEGNDTNVIKGVGKYLNKTKYILFECSDCLDDHRGPQIQYPMKDIVFFLSKNGFDTYRIGSTKMIKVNDEYWDDTYDKIKFYSNCFSIKKTDPIIKKIIDENFNYIE